VPPVVQHATCRCTTSTPPPPPPPPPPTTGSCPIIDEPRECCNSLGQHCKIELARLCDSTRDCGSGCSCRVSSSAPSITTCFTRYGSGKQHHVQTLAPDNLTPPLFPHPGVPIVVPQATSCVCALNTQHAVDGALIASSTGTGSVATVVTISAVVVIVVVLVAVAVVLRRSSDKFAAASSAAADAENDQEVEGQTFSSSVV
jgi:hypothetical protein